MKLMTWAKIKTAVWIGGAAVVVTTATTVVVNQVAARAGSPPANSSADSTALGANTPAEAGNPVLLAANPPGTAAYRPAVAADPPGIDDSIWERPTDLAALPQVIIVRPTHFSAPTSPEPAPSSPTSSGIGPGGNFGRGGSFAGGGTFSGGSSGPGDTTQKDIVSVRYGESTSRTIDILAGGAGGPSYHRERMLAKAYPFSRLIQHAYEAEVKSVGAPDILANLVGALNGGRPMVSSSRGSFQSDPAGSAGVYPLSNEKLMVLPPDAASKRYDVLMTVSNGSAALLAQAIQDQLGFVAHYEEVETDVLLLTMRQPGAPGLRNGNAAARGGNTSGMIGGAAGGAGGGGAISGPATEVDGHFRGGGGGGGGGTGSQPRSYSNVISFDNRRAGYHNIIFTNQPISHLVKDLDICRFVTDPAGEPTKGDTTPTIFAPLILDRTGLTGTYTVHLEWEKCADQAAEAQAVQTALYYQLGLQLVPARERVKLLVVELMK
jgi:uncharacterized membrane protein YgcG